MKKKMRFALSTLTCFATLVGCGHAVKIPDVEIYKEIPFVDGPEGMGYKIRSGKMTNYRGPFWERLRPELVCLDADGWYMIKEQWLRACRFAGQSCDLEVETIETTIRALDDLVKRVVEGQRLD